MDRIEMLRELTQTLPESFTHGEMQDDCTGEVCFWGWIALQCGVSLDNADDFDAWSLWFSFQNDGGTGHVCDVDKQITAGRTPREVADFAIAQTEALLARDYDLWLTLNKPDEALATAGADA